MFTKHGDNKPKDGQVVWLLIEGETLPRPAMYSIFGREDSYELLGCRIHTPKAGDSWDTLDPPVVEKAF